MRGAEFHLKKEVQGKEQQGHNRKQKKTEGVFSSKAKAANPKDEQYEYQRNQEIGGTLSKSTIGPKNTQYRNKEGRQLP